jgi:hypothetical protein
MPSIEEEIELQEYKLNCLKDAQHQERIHKLCESYKKKQINYMKECIIKNKIIYIRPKHYTDFIDFTDD